MPPLAPSLRSRDEAGFSLIEVTLALGIIAFALLPLIGLLSVGLDSYRDAAMRDQATQILGQLTACIKGATPVFTIDPTSQAATPQMDPADNTPEYSALAPYQDATMSLTATNKSPTPNPYALTWGINGKIKTVPPVFYYDATGALTSDATQRRLAATIVLQPPTSKFEAGSALIVVSWPVTLVPPTAYTPAVPAGSARPTLGHLTFGASDSKPISPQGHVEAIITFTPNTL